ncbi:interferon gamma isoform X2 [Hemicordylus capensis]|uniref:interferon gamma isoform X2 n=1 Tax=Hemicordylus capensis TaxID=884348 RepID=UPI002303D6BF|nr:interferon gamma isoform X2 [Hemicordylus capensis]
MTENTSQSDVAEGGSIFIHILDSKHWAQVEEKKILLAQLISMYLKMLTDISKTRTAKHIRDIVGALEDYEIKFSESLKKANDLMELVKLPMNDVKIQRKAVKELYHVLLEVHKEENKERRKRSRRHNPQVQNRCKPNLSG